MALVGDKAPYSLSVRNNELRNQSKECAKVVEPTLG